VREALEAGKGQPAELDGIRYLRLIDDHKSVRRGTVVLDERVVYGYPRIGRLTALAAGLRQQFPGPVWAEEKIDGYNVRIARPGDRVLAFSRGGFVCPFTTDRLPDLMDPALFEREPDLVVCAEVAGPENPYQEIGPPFVERDVELFAFDLMRLDRPGFVPQEEKLDLFRRHAVPATRIFGRFGLDDLSGVREILRELDAQWREGLVFKEDGTGERRAKYATGNSNIADIRSTAYNLMELPPDYYTNRILRLALYREEVGPGESGAPEQALGAAFLQGLGTALRRYREEGRVYHPFRCRFRARASALRMMEMLERAAGASHVQVSQRDLRREGGYWVLDFDRIYPSINGILGNLAAGGLTFD
jgi:putative ATP-dependent DNA ligase